MNKLAKQLLPFSSLLFIISLWTFLEPDTFLTLQNFKNVLSSSAANGIIAAGMTFVIKLVELDLDCSSLPPKGMDQNGGTSSTFAHV